MTKQRPSTTIRKLQRQLADAIRRADEADELAAELLATNRTNVAQIERLYDARRADDVRHRELFADGAQLVRFKAKNCGLGIDNRSHVTSFEAHTVSPTKELGEPLRVFVSVDADLLRMSTPEFVRSAKLRTHEQGWHNLTAELFRHLFPRGFL